MFVTDFSLRVKYDTVATNSRYPHYAYRAYLDYVFFLITMSTRLQLITVQ